MTISQSHANTRAGVLAHVDAVRASQTRSASDFGTPGRNMARRMVAVTVALSEPLDAPELDWAGTIAANLRLLYGNTTVEIIDTWRTDQ